MMGVKKGHLCAAINCNNENYSSKYSFFLFPKDVDRARIWAEACGRQDLLSKVEILHKSQRICGSHFDKRMFLNDLQNRLHSHAVPTIFCSFAGGSSIPYEHDYCVFSKDSQRNNSCDYDDAGESTIPPKVRILDEACLQPANIASNGHTETIQPNVGILEETCLRSANKTDNGHAETIQPNVRILEETCLRSANKTDLNIGENIDFEELIPKISCSLNSVLNHKNVADVIHLIKTTSKSENAVPKAVVPEVIPLMKNGLKLDEVSPNKNFEEVKQSFNSEEKFHAVMTDADFDEIIPSIKTAQKFDTVMTNTDFEEVIPLSSLRQNADLKESAPVMGTSRNLNAFQRNGAVKKVIMKTRSTQTLAAIPSSSKRESKLWYLLNEARDRNKVLQKEIEYLKEKLRNQKEKKM